jgi:hypothetical protein
VTIQEWLANARREINSPCWNDCGAVLTKVGYGGYLLGFWCPSCDVGWAVEVERSSSV